MRLFALSLTDGYKLGHDGMYANGTTKVYANLTPRSDRLFRRNATKFYDGRLVWIGAQGAWQEIKEHFDLFFASPKEKVIERFRRRVNGYLGADISLVERMAELHDLGYLPLQVRSIAEGTRVPFGVPVMTVTNTLPQFFWLVNFLETLISDLTWKTATNATIAAEYQAIVNHYGDLTGVDAFTRLIQIHDFSMRGMSGPEDAARAGFAPLAVGFIGTDTLPSIDYAEDYYDARADELIAISVPATEHAVATSNILLVERYLDEGQTPPTQFMKYFIAAKTKGWSNREIAEMLFMLELITIKHPTGIVSYVADSFDYWFVVTEILPLIKDAILARQPSAVAPAKLVIRPDSGNPVNMVCGHKWSGRVYANVDELKHVSHAQDIRPGCYELDDEYNQEAVNINGVFFEIQYDGHGYAKPIMSNVISEHEVKGTVELLWETFGGTETDKGFKQLDTHIGVIYGDSITTQRSLDILENLMIKGFASGNVVFGVGSYTYQHNTRDTFGFAVKATYTEVGDIKVPIFKDPKTDSKKKSAKGLLFVGYNTDGGYVLEDNVSAEDEASDDNKLKLIFQNGDFVKRTSLSEIRARMA